MTGRTLVWIDAREAVIVGWQDDEARVERLESDVPAHHRSTGHVRHDPTVRHGGGGPSQTADEPRRLEHLARFVERVASRLAPDDGLILLGPGTVREHLARQVREMDARQGLPRDISCEASARQTDRQLIARLRHVLDVDPPRRRVGPYRRTRTPIDGAAGHAQPRPRRVVDKRSIQPDPRKTVEGGENGG